MLALSRRPLNLAVVGAATAAMLLGSVASAQAAAPALKTVTMDQVFGALPLAKQLPGAVRMVDKFETPGSAAVDVCPELDLSSLISQLTGGSTSATLGVRLKGSMVGADYLPARSQTPQAKTAAWSVGAVVFHTAALAKAAAATVAAAEKTCPKSSPPIPDFPVSFSLVRADSAAYAVDGWTGYRTVDKFSTLDLLQGPDPVGSRSTQVFLTRGNLMMFIVETGDIEPGTVARQEGWRKTATKLMLAKLDRLLT
ncbi:MAG: hypothetical protein QOD91_2446 [Frankiales bacterium]|nr:hypothetical protein [Frankiales bacterium]